MSVTDRAKISLALAFDYGTQRIGIAVGQTLTGTASALDPIKARQGIPDWTEVQKIIDTWQPDLLVVGIPYYMDGSESKMSQAARKFARRLSGRFNLPFFEVDERLSTFEARLEAPQKQKSAKKPGRLDSQVAKRLLESWLGQSTSDS